MQTLQKKLKTWIYKESNPVLNDEHRDAINWLLVGGIFVLFLSLTEGKLLHFSLPQQKNMKNYYRIAQGNFWGLLNI